MADIDHNRSRELELEYGIEWADRLQPGHCLEHPDTMLEVPKLADALVCMAQCEKMPEDDPILRWHCWLEIGEHAIDLTRPSQRVLDRVKYREYLKPVKVFRFNAMHVMHNKSHCGDQVGFWPLSHPGKMKQVEDA